MVAGGEALLSALDRMVAGMGSLKNITADQKVEMTNLRAEATALSNTLRDSPNIERERYAAGWVEGIGQKVIADEIPVEEGVNILTAAHKRLREEMDLLPGSGERTAEQERSFKMLLRLMELVQGGITNVRDEAEREFNLRSLGDALKAAQEFYRLGERVPEGVLSRMAEGGLPIEFFTAWNDRIAEVEARGRELEAVFKRLAVAEQDMAMSQRLSGEAVNTKRNRVDALRSALEELYALEGQDPQVVAERAAPLWRELNQAEPQADIQDDWNEQLAFVREAKEAAAAEVRRRGGTSLEADEAMLNLPDGSLIRNPVSTALLNNNSLQPPLY